VYSADDAGPSITTIPVTSVDAAVQFRDSDKSGSVLVLGIKDRASRSISSSLFFMTTLRWVWSGMIVSVLRLCRDDLERALK
jgi:hypothetical protein